MFYQIVVLIVLGLTQVHSKPQVVAGALTAIGTVITASSSLLPNTPPGSKGGCFWNGNAPICGNEGCPPSHGYEQVGTLSECPDTPEPSPLDLIIPFSAVIKTFTLAADECHIGARKFGHACIEGQKYLCCKSALNDNSWNGQWESTDGNTWRCSVELDSSAYCNGTLICENQDDVRLSWQIGGKAEEKAFCRKLEFPDGEGEAGEARVGRINWTSQETDQTGNKWFKV